LESDVISSQQSAERAVTARGPAPHRTDQPAGRQRAAAGGAGGESAVSGAGETANPPECVGPIRIPADLTHRLRSLSAAAGADDFLPLSICASVLMRRLSRDGAPGRARVIRGAREAVTPLPAGPPDPTTSFRAALRAAVSSRPVTVPDATTCPVEVTILVTRDGASLYVESMTSSADAPLAQCWARSFLALLAAAAAEPDRPMADHPLVDEAERARILGGLNPYRPPLVRHRTMAGPFEEQVALTPDAVALVDSGGATVSYRELNERANRLAHFLRAGGAGPGTRVGICLGRGVELIVAIYAAVKTGAGYVPLDADLPDARLAYLLSDAGPLHVLTDPAGRARIPAGPWRVLDVAGDAPLWTRCPAADPVVDTAAPSSLLHLLYTSGTTGRPKGVASATDAALAHLAWMQSRYPYGPRGTALFKTSPGFDVSIWEVFWPLYHGARLVICRPGGHRDPRHLADLVETHAVTTIFLAPTVMAPFLEKVSGERAGALRWALCGGEPVTPRIRDTFHATLPGAALVNCYGPTEAGNVTDMVVPPNPGSPVVPLGRPAGHFRLTLLDENLDLVPVGMPGEAYIGGDPGLAQSYWRAPGRTAERFVPDPYGPPGSRMYRTGDLCRYRDDGVLEHLGRIDRQIKIRGLRIEPGEIESVLAAHPAVADCAVLAHGAPTRLLAFVVPAGRVSVDELDVPAILEHAARMLPDHMRPDRVAPVLRIPATVNGKIDKDALIHVWRALTDRGREVVPPADELEADLVEIYRRVLSTEPVSMLDTFTGLGGDSLLALRMVEECLDRLHAQPDVARLFTGTVRDVAMSIRAARATPGAGS
jgi:amino acid adenylation domain-containing protein